MVVVAQVIAVPGLTWGEGFSAAVLEEVAVVVVVAAASVALAAVHLVVAVPAAAGDRVTSLRLRVGSCKASMLL